MEDPEDSSQTEDTRGKSETTITANRPLNADGGAEIPDTVVTDTEVVDEGEQVTNKIWHFR
jgi:hypothetical protein